MPPLRQRFALTGLARPRPGFRGRQILQVQMRCDYYRMPNCDQVLSSSFIWVDATWEHMQALPGFRIGQP
jgi:hypothetical protein